MRWAEISVEAAAASEEPLSAVLVETGCAGVVIGAARSRVGEHGGVLVTGYLPVDDRLEPALDDLRARLDVLRECGIDVGDGLTLRTRDDVAWATAWRAFYKPLRVGRHWLIKPTWETVEPLPGDRVIELDPGMAFGTGTHPTTQMCLEALEGLVRGGERVLDWGTGSGILSIGAALLGAASVLSLDMDPVAVDAARENIERNGVAATVEVRVGGLEATAGEPPFEIAVANIVADPILDGLPELAQRMVPGGMVVLSGIIADRAAEIEAALAELGFAELERWERGEWRAFTAVRA